MRRIVCILLSICLLFSSAIAEESPTNVLDSIGGWFSQAAEDTADWASQAWEDTTNWAAQSWDDVSSWTANTWGDISTWTIQAWHDVSSWTVQAWTDSTKWVEQTWNSSAAWVTANWDHFIVWVNKIASGDPYAWMQDSILNTGILAYDNYVSLRTFLATDPDPNQIRHQYETVLLDLSCLAEDTDILWNMLQQWAESKSLSVDKITTLGLPYLIRLKSEGESAIGENVLFSGPVVAQYLITILETLSVETDADADMKIKILKSSLDAISRPVIIGDMGQNALITDDHFYIEYFTFADGKYKIIMIVSAKDDTSEYPMMHGASLEQITQHYFRDSELGISDAVKTSDGSPAQTLSFTTVVSEIPTTGKAVAVWTSKNDYRFFVMTQEEWLDDEFNSWFSSLAMNDAVSVSLAVDIESDGSFFGINQGAQKYTINRIFEENRFLHPISGNGWAAERGNNLIDNIKGIIKGSHSTIIGDNNAKNGADRLITYADGSKLLIQSKYYATASQSVAACFDNGTFRYMDASGKPMAIEVPFDQYDDAIRYMENRIANGQVEGVTDKAQAVEIVKKGSLTFQQAKHIAKAGTVESILYDSAHACVSARNSMGLSAAVTFAVNLWNGQSFETSIKESIYQGLHVGGTSFIISVLSSQIAKTGLNTAMIPASQVVVHALGPKVSAVIVNAFRPAGSAIYGAAAMQSAAKLLRGNVITSAVSFVVLSAGDVADIIQGRISWKQLAKNAATTAAGLVGGTLGYLGGAAIGSAILPGAGTVVGIIFSVAAGWGANEGTKVLVDFIAEDDADEMIRILESQFPEIAAEYFLNQEEVNRSIENLQVLLSAEMLKQMYQYDDHYEFARQLIEMAIDPVVTERPYVELPSEELYSGYLTDFLEDMYEEINSEPITN